MTTSLCMSSPHPCVLRSSKWKNIRPSKYQLYRTSRWVLGSKNFVLPNNAIIYCTHYHRPSDIIHFSMPIGSIEVTTVWLTAHKSGNLDSIPTSVTGISGQITAAPIPVLSFQTAPINNDLGLKGITWLETELSFTVDSGVSLLRLHLRMSSSFQLIPIWTCPQFCYSSTLHSVSLADCWAILAQSSGTAISLLCKLAEESNRKPLKEKASYLKSGYTYQWLCNTVCLGKSQLRTWDPSQTTKVKCTAEPAHLLSQIKCGEAQAASKHTTNTERC